MILVLVKVCRRESREYVCKCMLQKCHRWLYNNIIMESIVSMIDCLLCNRFSEHSSLYNVHLLSDSQVGDCKPSHDGGALIFYASPSSFLNSTYQISSRQVVIGPLNIVDVKFDTVSSHAEAAVLNNIKKDESLRKVFNLVRCWWYALYM